MNFNVGDRVKCLTKGGNIALTIGAEYTVARDTGEYVHLKEIAHEFFYKHRFALVPKTENKEELLERLEVLWKKLDMEGSHVRANTVHLAIEYIKGNWS